MMREYHKIQSLFKRDEEGEVDQVSRENLIERVCEYSQRVKTDEW
jgi:hypothetical protein